jgi:hypothetical protein
MALVEKTFSHSLNGCPGGGPKATGLLHRVGGIKNHWTAQGLELGQTAVVHHQGVIDQLGSLFGGHRPSSEVGEL